MLGSFLAFALPPRRAGCGQIVDGDDRLCAACWQSLDFLTDPGCLLCGMPLAPHLAVCAPCLRQAPLHDGVRAAVAYGDIARTLVLKLKHGRRVGLARMLARFMAAKIMNEPGVLVPVPAHRWRLLRRGFNQSALIAQYLSRLCGLRTELDWLLRNRSTTMLRDASAREREKIVRGAFRVPSEARSRLQGQSILLVDDVYTSGATANACARALKRAGADRVQVICWARVISPQASD